MDPLLPKVLVSMKSLKVSLLSHVTNQNTGDFMKLVQKLFPFTTALLKYNNDYSHSTTLVYNSSYIIS